MAAICGSHLCRGHGVLPLHSSFSVGGVRPLEPGCGRVLIQPQPGALTHAAGTVPTPLGGVAVSLTHKSGEPFVLSVEIPEGMKARVGVPENDSGSNLVWVNGRQVAGERGDGYLFVGDVGPGKHTLSNGSRERQR